MFFNLKNTLYGLKQILRAWRDIVRNFLLNNSFKTRWVYATLFWKEHIKYFM